MSIGQNLRRLLSSRAVQKAESEAAQAVERDVTDSLKKLGGRVESEGAEALSREASQVSPTLAEELASQATDYTKPLPGELAESVGKSSSKLKKAAKIGVGLGTAGLAGYSLFGGGGSPPQPTEQPPTSLVPQKPVQLAAGEEKKPASVEAKPKVSVKKGSSVKKTEAPAQQNPDDAKELLDRVFSEDDSEPEKFLDFGSAEENKNDFANVQEQQNLAVLANQLGKAGEIVGSGIARANPVAQQAFDENTKLAQNITKQYLDQKAQEENDPLSGTSKAARDYIKQFGINVSDGATAGQLKQVMPYVFKDFEAKQAAQARREILDANMANQREMLKDRLEQRKYEADQRSKDRAISWAQIAQRKKEADDLKKMATERQTNEKLLGDIGGSRQLPNVRQAYLDLYNVQKAKPLFADKANLSPQQISLLVTELAKVAGGKAPTIEELRALNPDTLNSRFARSYSFLMNERTPAAAQSFLKDYEDYLNHIEHNARGTIRSSIGNKIEGRKRYLNPEDYEYAMDRYVNNPEKYEGGEATEAMAFPDLQKGAQAELLRRSMKKDEK